MILLKGLCDFGSWLKKDKFYLTNNLHAHYVIKKGYAIHIMEISREDLSFMLADFKVNGVPECLVKYFTRLKGGD